jgi:hypothetical protein
MKFSDIYSIVKAHIEAGDTQTVFSVLGSPGCGKSALGTKIGKDFGFDFVWDANFSYLDLPDVAGLYFPGADGTLDFKANPNLQRLTTGRNLLIIDEATDANMLMQNLARRMFWTREINGIKLSPETYVMLLGNRSQDKSGAGKFSGKVKNAISQFTMESNLDDWVEWALTDGNIDPLVIQFLRFKPGLLDDYKPDADCSPTPRQWELVSRVPSTLPDSLYMLDVAAKVGEGPAAEFTAFRKIYQSLISFEDIIINPEGVPIPKDLSAQYAIVGSVAHNVKPDTAERAAKFITRMPSDFQVMFWTDSMRKTPAIKTCKPFIQWASSSANVIFN